MEIIKSAAAEINIDPKQVAVYLGYYSANADEESKKLINECIAEFKRCADFRACFEKVAVSVSGNAVDLGFMRAESRSLAKNLDGCRSAYIFAATAGAGSQRFLDRCSLLSPLRGIVADCVGSAAIEAFCDKINFSFENPDFLRPRFSPGYGDLPLEYQNRIVEFLGTKKNIGMSLTDSLMMVPLKSVTAIIGIGDEKNKCKGPGCMICCGKNCPYRD